MMQKGYQETARHGVPQPYTEHQEICLQADIIIAALGVPEFLKGDMVKEGVVIDVGTTRVPNTNSKSGFKLTGDVAFRSIAKCSHITPVPGGVGPMTIVSLPETPCWQEKGHIFLKKHE